MANILLHRHHLVMVSVFACGIYIGKVMWARVYIRKLLKAAKGGLMGVVLRTQLGRDTGKENFLDTMEVRRLLKVGTEHCKYIRKRLKSEVIVVSSLSMLEEV